MSEDSHPQHHRGFFDRILHPEHHHEDQEEHHGQQDSQDHESHQKESEFDKIKEDIKEDQKEVAEGNVYDGLM
ncbi:hypothetical protein BDV33DRAFT_203143 [Aspergillus novoparasiticus]|uniref:Uncharacterized protein n=1 Tax=Aspergillus novoparasiticus TaxID=986946 RepID=A0A5N6EV50_9EURO|nr:hypothetical protein BDV33DRAFT_203143 [Aspergillus novoparasiticus]